MLTKTKIALAVALIAGTASVASAQSTSHRNGQIRTAPVRLQNQGTFQEPSSQGAGRLPGAFQYQVQPGYPQSPPGGGGN